MMRRIAIVVPLLVGACDDDEPECSIGDRNGTYLFTYVEISGNCGPIDAQLDQATQVLPAGCSFDANDRWSDDECKLERAYTCEVPALGEGFTSSFVAVTEQQDDDGANVTGLITLTVHDGSGALVCGSTYEMDAERQ